MALVIGKNPNGETLDYLDGVTSYADTVVGNLGADIIRAGGGDDWVKGGGGADLLDGGSGFDTATYEDSTAGVDVSLVSGKGFGGSAQGDTLISIENLYGSNYNDSLVGNNLDNVLSGAAGNDTLKGGGGADTMDGGAGNDWIEIDNAKDKAIGGDGIDTLSMNTSIGISVNLQAGMLGANTYNSPETYSGGYGYHHHHHGPFGTNVPWTADGVPNASGFENVKGSNFNDRIIGSDLANEISGEGGNDILTGRGGDDVLSGGYGKDYMFGGTGADKLTGGADGDRFIWTNDIESLFTAGRPQDVITDFEQFGDRIDLSSLNIGLTELLVKENQAMDGASYTFVGADTNHNGAFDEGEFAIAVKMAQDAHLNAGDFIF